MTPVVVIAHRFVFVLLALAMLFAMPVAAGPAQNRLVVLLSSDEAVYQETWESFRDTLLGLAGPALPFDIRLVTLDHDESGDVDDEAAGSPDLVIPVGAQAARFAALHHPGTPVLSILITRDAHEAIWPAPWVGATSALFLEQPLDRQFRLLRLTLPGLRNVSVVLGSRSRQLSTMMTAAARRSDFALHIVDFEAQRAPVDAFTLALERGDAVLAFPDTEVLSPSHAKWLLYMAYQQRVPVFGFSSALTDAGALAALYTTPDQVGREAAERVFDIALDARERPGRPWRLPPPAYPRYFHVSVNRAVARALDFDTSDQQQLAHSLWTIEQSDRMQADQGRYDPGRALP